MSAQQIDNSLSFKNINTNSYFRFNYENDFFSATDEYYTQGIKAELASPKLKNFPLIKLLITPTGATKYSIALEHNGYTPSSIQHAELLYGDRPFCATLMFQGFSITIDTTSKHRFSNSITTGVIGQAAGGAEMQTGIHRWLNNVTPRGWIYQIHNDAILNYQMDYEKELYSYKRILSIGANATGRIGTLSDKISIGTTIIMGHFNSPYSTITGKQAFSAYAYEHARVNIVGYDATLQGGVFNHTSPYTITATNIERVVFENRFGIVVSYNGIILEYFQSYLSPEFKTQSYHVWGGIQIAFEL